MIKTGVSILLALLINFKAPGDNTYRYIENEKYPSGFPYQYHINEGLDPKESQSRINLIFMNFVLLLSGLVTVAPVAEKVITVPIYRSLYSHQQNEALKAIRNNIQVAEIPAGTIDKISIKELEIIDRLIIKIDNGEINITELLFSLRGGDLSEDLAEVVAKLGVSVVVAILLNNIVSEGFQTVPAPSPDQQGQNFNKARTHWDLLFNNGKPKNQCPTQMGVSLKASTSADNGYVYPQKPRNASYKQIENVYKMMPPVKIPGTDRIITGEAAAAHAHHGPVFGIDSKEYGLNKADLNNIAKVGYKAHIRNGGNPIPLEYVAEIQQKWLKFTQFEGVEYTENSTVMGKKSGVYKNPRESLFVAIDSKTNKAITGYRLTVTQNQKFNDYKMIGQNYTNNKK